MKVEKQRNPINSKIMCENGRGRQLQDDVLG